MKENIQILTNRDEITFLEGDDRIQAFIDLRDLGVAFYDKDREALVTDSDELDECLGAYAVEHWDKVKKDLVSLASMAIDRISRADKLGTYMQVCGDYLENLVDARDKLNTFIEDLESRGNRYLD